MLWSAFWFWFWRSFCRREAKTNKHMTADRTASDKRLADVRRLPLARYWIEKLLSNWLKNTETIYRYITKTPMAIVWSPAQREGSARVITVHIWIPFCCKPYWKFKKPKLFYLFQKNCVIHFFSWIVVAANGKTPLEPPAFENLRLRTKWFDKWYKLKIDGFIFFPWCTNWNTIRAAGNLERLDCNILSFKAIKRSCARPRNHTWSGMVSLQSLGRNLELTFHRPIFWTTILFQRTFTRLQTFADNLRRSRGGGGCGMVLQHSVCENYNSAGQFSNLPRNCQLGFLNFVPRNWTKPDFPSGLYTKVSPSIFRTSE